MSIYDVIEMIPEDSQDEALMAVETVTAFPAEDAARIRCVMSREFKLRIELRGEQIAISAKGRRDVVCSFAEFLSVLRRTIYTIDEAMAEGSYRQSATKPNIITDDRPATPADMDIPVWDEERGQWYDAEY